MSEKKDILELIPPTKDLSLYIGKERFVYPEHRCGICYGQGYHWIDGEDGQIKVPCPGCDGTGQVKAIVTVAWRSDGERKPYWD